jgi:very-short-patch-repair endonuclease
MRRINPAIQLRARELRKNQTPAEVEIWHLLRGRQASGYKFRRQHAIGNFIVDFYCPAAKLVIEIDGDTHLEQVEYDQTRTDWIESQGYQVIRFTNRQVSENISAVLKNILEHCKING